MPPSRLLIFRMRGFLAALFLWLSLCGIAGAQEVTTPQVKEQEVERITAYDVHLKIEQSADIIVTESISVISEGRKIRRGIFRDLPRFKVDEGENIPYQYTILSVTRNGQAEQFDASKSGNARRVRVGDADVFLPSGRHDYVIEYRVKNEIRYGEDADELYWNATGNFWNFPIDAVRVTVALPEGARLLESNAYTGRLGARGQSYEATRIEGGVVFTATRPFTRGEGMTISARFTPGIVAPLTVTERGLIWWFKNGALVLLSLSLIGLFVYYYAFWNKVGRDPQKQPVFARYTPPKGYSPAATATVRAKGIVGLDGISATLVNMAIKGMIKMDVDKKNIGLIPLSPTPKTGELFAEESALYAALFKGSNTPLYLTGSYSATFTKAQTAMASDLSKRFGKDYFHWNMGYIFGGIVLSLITIGAAMTQIYAGLKPSAIFVLVALLALNVLFAFLLPAPTRKGAKVFGQIEGFRLYLKTAEAGRLNAVTVGEDAPPPMSQALYERFLPYAMALDVEKPWSKAFETAMPQAAKDYNPSWSAVNSGRFSGPADFSKSLSSGLSSGVSSAMPQSSSSSGGGGGGSSGGGGGGGGGGGW